MGRKAVRTPRVTRREKLMQERIESLKGSPSLIQSPQARQTPRLEAKNQNQKTALRYLAERRPIVMLTGSAGTGKSLLAAYHAATLLHSKQVEKIYLVRPAVGVGKSIGMLPGTVEEKLNPYFAQTVAHLEKFLGTGHTKYLLEKKVIEMQPAEYIRGRSFENCVVICEESQGFTHAEFEMMLTRLGDGCQMIFTGDEKQSDLKVETGLRSTVRLIENAIESQPDYLDDEDLDAFEEQIGVVRFLPEDVVRSGLTRAFVKLYFNA